METKNLVPRPPFSTSTKKLFWGVCVSLLTVLPFSENYAQMGSKQLFSRLEQFPCDSLTYLRMAIDTIDYTETGTVSERRSLFLTRLAQALTVPREDDENMLLTYKKAAMLLQSRMGHSIVLPELGEQSLYPVLFSDHVLLIDYLPLTMLNNSGCSLGDSIPRVFVGGGKLALGTIISTSLVSPYLGQCVIFVEPLTQKTYQIDRELQAMNIHVPYDSLYALMLASVTANEIHHLVSYSIFTRWLRDDQYLQSEHAVLSDLSQYYGYGSSLLQYDEYASDCASLLGSKDRFSQMIILTRLLVTYLYFTDQYPPHPMGEQYSFSLRRLYEIFHLDPLNRGWDYSQSLFHEVFTSLVTIPPDQRQTSMNMLRKDYVAYLKYIAREN
ncbi:MAG: hypothetical protein NZL83_03305 [Candidatus Absconditabacterales bacterium]|nr:hypothetical protein [Candidatus Absconditabacterales bacterium]